MPTSMQTERTTIRPFTATDITELAPILADKEVMHFSVTGPLSLQQAVDILENVYVPSSKDPVLGIWAVTNKLNGELIGFCGLVKQVVDGEHTIELGYRLAKKYWGQGLATEITQAIKEHALSKGLKELIAIIPPDNVRSIRVAEKMGMTYRKTTIYFGITVHIYQLKNSKADLPQAN